MKINEKVNGFKLLSIKEIKDLNSKMYEFIHEKSGGKVLYMENDETNNVFGIAFKTLPEDSTGVCHIIEHSVLCGSKKYPLKEPFVNLIKSSLATFLNAFTASDWTCYPIASQTPKDFNNLMDVYLDAVFHPLSMVDNKPFLQEGWHLELLKEEDTPQYKGVVYNEMKGAMSSVDEILRQETLNAFYKDNIYSNNSGGDPDVIPNLTYKQYQDFYSKHYTPENAITFLYGKMDIEEKLGFINNYFNEFNKVGCNIQIEYQKPFINLDVEKEYPIGKEETIKDNYHTTICYKIADFDNVIDNKALNFVFDTLLGGNDSPLKKKLLDAKLGQDIDYMVDESNLQPSFSISLRKTNKECKEKFLKIFEEEVANIVKEGIDKKLLLSTINSAEFSLKEFDTGRTPKGLIIAFDLINCALYNSSVENRLNYNMQFKTLKDNLNTSYYEDLLTKYILNSNHKVQVLLKPSLTLQDKKDKEMQDKMMALKASMSKDEIKALVKQTQDLLTYQNKVDTPKELKMLPQLKIKDIPTTERFLTTKKANQGKLKGYYHELDTTGIAYLNMFFNLDVVTEEDFLYLHLFRNVFGCMPTKHYSINEIQTLIKLYLGNFGVSIDTFYNEKKELQTYMQLHVSALNENTSHIHELVNEVLNNTKYSAKEFKTIIKQTLMYIRNGLIQGGTVYATNYARAAYSKDAKIALYTTNSKITYDFYDKLDKNFNFKEIKEKLSNLAKKIFAKSNVSCFYSGSKESINLLKKEAKQIKLSKEISNKVLDIKLTNTGANALIIPSGVSYNVIATKLDFANETKTGSWQVLSHLAHFDYLWTNIRVVGGAYGCGLNVYKDNTVVLTSYRDPNVKNSYEVYRNISQYLRNLNMSSNEFKNYIIGTMAAFTPKSIPLEIAESNIRFLSNTTKQDLINYKKEILSSTLEKIKSFADIFDKMYETSTNSYTIGNQAKIDEYSFDSKEVL